MTTNKQHQRQQYRNRDGKYSEVNKCQRCGKSAGVDYCSDARTDTDVLGISIGDEALCLCDKCASLMADMDDCRFLIEIRREDYGNLPRGKDVPLTNADVLSSRAAAGMCDTGEMAATMQQARCDITQSAEAMQALYEVHVPGYTDGHWWLTDAEAEKFRADGCTVRACHCGEMDFSLCNDAALTGIADQAEDMLDWQWMRGDLAT